MPELTDEIRSFIESGIRPVTLTDIRAHTVGNRLPVPRPRSKVLVGGLVGAAAIVVLLVLSLVVLPSGTPGGSTSAAAAGLKRLSDQAVSSTTTLSPGQYAYTSLQIQSVVLAGSTPQGTTVHAYLSGTQQTWVNAAGTGRMVITTDPTLHFFSAADRSAWLAAGSPSLADPNQTAPQIYTVSPTLNPATVQAPLYQVGGLSTNPATLERDLASGAVQVENFSNPGCRTQNCLVFAKAAALLQGPSVGMTPTLRSALFKVLAGVPGTDALGIVTNRAGQSGVGFRYVDKIPAQQLTTICDNASSGSSSSTRSSSMSTIPPETTTLEMIVDPKTTTVIGTIRDTTPNSFPTTSGPCSVRSARTMGFAAPRWTSLLAEGSASSDTASP